MRKYYIVAAARILAFLILIVGTISVISCANKIVSTAGNLIVLNGNIRYYNESARKTDKMTEEIEGYFAERAKYYNSEDRVIKNYANLPTLAKALVLLVALATYLALPAMWGILIMQRICIIRRRARKR